MSEHILVLGATGPSGLAFCELALGKGHRLTLYVRTPSKLPTWISGHERVTILVGELNDEEGLAKAAGCGASVLASFAGPLPFAKGTPITDGYKILYPLLIQNNLSRVLVLSTPSFEIPEDKVPLKWKAVILFIKAFGGSAFSEVNGIGEVTTDQNINELKWTVFRVPFLGNGENADIIAEPHLGAGADGMFLNRKDMARWVLENIGDNSKWVGKAPLLSH